MERRGFLGLVASGVAAAGLARGGWAAAGAPAFLGAAQLADGHHALFGVTETGAEIFRIALPARGHAGVAHPARPLAVAFARRPGVYALVIDCVEGREIARLAPPQGRQFNGHGAFSADGTLLYTSEVVAEGSAGRIGLWETRGWRRVGEFGSAGIGPHEILRLPGTETLVVANGGIRTDPQDRTPLNLADMRPNLAFLSYEGEVLDMLELPDLRQNSIRHLALREDGLVAFAMQWQGDPAEPVPQLGLYRSGGPVRLAAPLVGEELAMKGYAGSVRWDRSGVKVAITSPKGGRVQVFDAEGTALYSVARADVCGLGPVAGVQLAPAGAAPRPSARPAPEGPRRPLPEIRAPQPAGMPPVWDFTITDGQGLTAWIGPEGLRPGARLAAAWDNHLISLA